ncbi:MAG TPA: hotdog fold thioesterase [Cytophagaceae bacterium]|jgi:1,4-dihydroxy-2-naphthoyl-CoA hydrolase|nr:hotdog fold thioesterase [Cytophagaceae bacterium]
MLNTEIQLNEINKLIPNTICEQLGIEFIEIGKDFISGKMPVDKRTHQPMGLLHGGASVVLAETLGSVGSYLCVDSSKYYCVGLEINANHVKGMKDGYVFGKATLLHAGKKTHIWDIRITNDKSELVCVSRLTVAVIDKK